jgi:transketolase
VLKTLRPNVGRAGASSLPSTSDVRDVEERCLRSIYDILELHGLGHTGGSLSVLHILISLYFDIGRIDPHRPRWPERDRIVLSKGHAVEAMYAVLAERGFFSTAEFQDYLRFQSTLQGHTERVTPGIEYSAGSLGQGLSFAIGLAYAGRLSGQDYRVFCVMGDGECHEGSVWEAAMAGPHYRLSNLYAIVDFNHYADHDNVDKLMNLQPFEERWKTFGWDTRYVERGNDVASISEALRGFETSDRPKLVIANTVKNYGVTVWEQAHVHMAGGDLLQKGLAEGRSLLGQRGVTA